MAQPEQFRRFNLAQFLSANENEPDETDPATQALFTPTEAWPGSCGKVSALRDRFQQGLPLWHRDDFRWDRGDMEE